MNNPKEESGRQGLFVLSCQQPELELPDGKWRKRPAKRREMVSDAVSLNTRKSSLALLFLGFDVQVCTTLYV